MHPYEKQKYKHKHRYSTQTRENQNLCVEIILAQFEHKQQFNLLPKIRNTSQ